MSVTVDQQFSAVARDASGTTISGQSFAWSSSNVGVATVHASTGLATSVGNGTSTITATIGAVSGTGSITVQQEAVDVVFSPDSLVLDRWADTARVTAQAVDAAGAPVAGASTTWSSSDAEVASVDASGLITTGVAGEAVITAEVTVAGANAAPSSQSSTAQTELIAEATIPVRVALQRNVLCVVPTTFPTRGPVAGPPTFDEVPGAFGSIETRYSARAPYAGVADFDGDGDQDIMFPNFDFASDSPGRLLFWRNVGGTFEDATEAGIQDSIRADHTNQVLTSDLNGDGIADLVLVQGGKDAPPFPGAPNVLLLSQDGGAFLDASSTNLVPNRPDQFTHGGASGDVDCDGDVDLWTGESGSLPPNYSNIYVNDGFGHFVAEPLRFPRLFNESSLLEDGSMGNYNWLVGDFCDLDRDGDNDLYLGGQIGSGAVPRDFIMVNDGFGHFRKAPAVLPSDQGLLPERVVCRDMNLDGLPDLVLFRPPLFLLWYNRGDLVFEDVTTEVFGGNPGSGLSLQVADLNGDGWPDIHPNSGSPPIFYINNGGAAFLQIDAPGPSAELIDANGDGKLDVVIVVLGGGGGTIALWLNR
ncbi:MAG: VCBS repeat-containing protein [Gemmatimonadetes bacterium]|nr:VCBS repeat-containing protein [Gemmatimonadota bacterium]